ncbi:helix-turn-helix domain-containing protein [Ravibacter arvi]
MEIASRQDLVEFKNELLSEIRILLSEKNEQPSSRWLRSAQVRRLLSISPGTLQQMRISGELKYTKVGGIHFYQASDIESMLLKNLTE